MSADPLGGFGERAGNSDGEKRTQLIGAELNHPSEVSSIALKIFVGPIIAEKYR
jgi:hypothetical protein